MSKSILLILLLAGCTGREAKPIIMYNIDSLDPVRDSAIFRQFGLEVEFLPHSTSRQTRENEYEFSKYVPMISNARKQDSTDMEKGEVYFQLTVKYYDEYQKENRVFSTRVTLKDHHSPQTLTERVILRDDKKENP